jgi:hypothetical protein
VDVVCQHVVYYFLLFAKDSPLMILSLELVMALDMEQLEIIAGEDEESKVQRQALERDIENLEAAIRLLRV